MATNITSSLFGLDPAEYLQQRNRADEQAALSYARLDPVQQAQQGLFQAGQSLARAGGDLFGMQDPQLKKMQAIQALSKNFDLSNPDGYSQFAQALSAGGFQNEAMKAIQIGQSLAEKESMIGYRKAQAEKLTQPGSKIGKMIEERDALAEKYGADDPRVKAIEQAIYKEGYIKPAKGKGGGGDGGGGGGAVDPNTGLMKPKAIGKAGAMIDAYGNPHSVGDMNKVNSEYRAFGNLIKTLENISPEDVKKSESFLGIDYTGALKGPAGFFNSNTQAAQSKVAGAALLKQIDNLPPGPASDKDMLAAKADFPGYGDYTKLQEWINNTAKLVRDKMAIYEEQFGFRQKGGKTTVVEGGSDPLDIRKGKTK